MTLRAVAVPDGATPVQADCDISTCGLPIPIASRSALLSFQAVYRLSTASEAAPLEIVDAKVAPSRMLWACPIYSPRASHLKARSSVKAHAIARREWQEVRKGTDCGHSRQCLEFAAVRIRREKG